MKIKSRVIGLSSASYVAVTMCTLMDSNAHSSVSQCTEPTVFGINRNDLQGSMFFLFVFFKKNNELKKIVGYRHIRN